MQYASGRKGLDMMSSDFGAIVSPLMNAMNRPRRRYARGGQAKGPKHLTVVIAMPNPMEGALMRALMLRHAQLHGLGALQRGSQ